MTMTSFAITLYGQCCWHHVVSQPVGSNICLTCSCWSICSLCSESNSANLLLCLLIDDCTWKFYCVWHIKLDLHGGAYLVTIDREFRDVTPPYLYAALGYLLIMYTTPLFCYFISFSMTIAFMQVVHDFLPNVAV